MSYTAITTTEIEAGKPNTEPLWEKVRANAEDHETRIQSAEAATNSFRPIRFEAVGRVKAGTSLLSERLNFNISISTVRLIVKDTGLSGTCEIDIKYRTSMGSYASIFSTRPSVVYTAGDEAVSTNGVLTSVPFNALAGGFLRLDIISVQGGQKTLWADIEYTPT